MALPDIAPFIKKKKIVIFGVGDIAGEFIDKYANSMDIVYFTSNDMTETEFHGLKRIEISELLLKKDIYIIICASQPGMAAIENQLSLGLKFFEEYIDYDTFEQLYVGKKKLIVVEGLCHQELVSYAIGLIPQVKNEYIIKFFWHANLKYNTALRKMVHMLCEYADYIIVLKLKGVKDNSAYYGNAQAIKMPLIYMPFLYPQIICSQEMGSTYLCNPYMMNAKKNIGDIRAFRYTDQNVVRLLKQGLSEEDVLSEISREDFYDMAFMDKLRQSSIYTNVINDESSDIHLGEYLIKHYRQEKLFLDGQHWSDVFAWEAIRQITTQMGIKEVDVPDINLIEMLSEKDAVWANEIPIYPSVRKLLELEWLDDETVYNMVKLKGIKKVSFHQYMRDYIQYVYHSLKLQEVW